MKGNDNAEAQSEFQARSADTAPWPIILSYGSRRAAGDAASPSSTIQSAVCGYEALKKKNKRDQASPLALLHTTEHTSHLHTLAPGDAKHTMCASYASPEMAAD